MARVAVIARTTINGRESKHFADQEFNQLWVSERTLKRVEARAGMGHIEWRLASATPDIYGEYPRESVMFWPRDAP